MDIDALEEESKLAEEAARLTLSAHQLAIVNAGTVVEEDAPEVREFAGILAFLKLWNPQAEFSRLADCLVQVYAQVKQTDGVGLLDFAKMMAAVYVQPYAA